MVVISSTSVLSTMLTSALLLKRRYSLATWIAAGVMLLGTCVGFPSRVFNLWIAATGIIAFAIPGLAMVGKEMP